VVKNEDLNRRERKELPQSSQRKANQNRILS
jgi:hypothetical protein